MKDFIFLIGPSGVGKSTLAQKLYKHYDGVYLEQSMVPEFIIPKTCEDEGLFEEDTCFQNTIMQAKWFYEKGFRNIVALDFDDLRVRELPIIFKGFDFIILRLYSSSTKQIKQQMEERHKSGTGLFYLEGVDISNRVISQRPLLPNEVKLDVFDKNKEEVFQEAVKLIDGTAALKDYEYQMPAKNQFRSWVQSNNLNQI